MNTLKMLGIVIFYTALLSSVFAISLRDKELEAVVKLLESQTNVKASSSEETSGGDDAHSFVEHNSKNEDSLNLIQQAIDQANSFNDRKRFKTESNFVNQLYQNSQYDTNKNNRDNYVITNKMLAQYLNRDKKPFKNSFQKRLTPNRLLSASQHKYENLNRRPKGDLNHYSKIFVIMDPIAIQKSRNTEDLPNLLSRILTQTSSAADRLQDRNNVRYKGFAVKDSSKSRRFRRDSKEMFAGDDDDYRPKRSRNDHNAVGSGGRTAIPYIRHRGDIYERDH